jgi:mRNA-degrading endonuclease toxin of MazEF toxin-antitoxin module
MQGIVAFGLIPSNAKDSTGDTIGGIGSAIAIQPGSWNAKSDGTFTGKLVVQPDRGYNMRVPLACLAYHSELTPFSISTVDYQARQHEIDFTLTPYYDDDDLSFKKSQKTLALTYKSTLLYTGPNGQKTSGLDALNKTATNPPIPLPNSTYQHASFDCEGLVLNNDGTQVLPRLDDRPLFIFMGV